MAGIQPEIVSTGSVAELVRLARTAAQHAYAPYSHFRVGAAVRCKDGAVFLGSNVENRSFGLTICAERCAIVAAIAHGSRHFEELAVLGLDAIGPLPPCGACRQVISEFFPPDAKIHFAGSDDTVKTVLLADLLPYDSLHDHFK